MAHYLCSTGAFRDSDAGAGTGAGFGNFWKRWVRVRRDSTIKKLLKIFLFIFSFFLYIFTIKIFLKNTLLCLDSKKKRKKKASFGFSNHIQGRFRPFRPFPASFGRIGCRPIRPDMANTARFWPNQPGSARIEANSVRIEPHWHESSRVGANPRKKKKKKVDADWRVGNRVGRGCGTSSAATVLSSSLQNQELWI